MPRSEERFQCARRRARGMTRLEGRHRRCAAYQQVSDDDFSPHVGQRDVVAAMTRRVNRAPDLGSGTNPSAVRQRNNRISRDVDPKQASANASDVKKSIANFGRRVCRACRTQHNLRPPLPSAFEVGKIAYGRRMHQYARAGLGVEAPGYAGMIHMTVRDHYLLERRNAESGRRKSVAQGRVCVLGIRSGINDGGGRSD